jgi:hypothetical protein
MQERKINLCSLRLIFFSCIFLSEFFFILAASLTTSALAQQTQNPSPMVEHTRRHTRLKQETPPGRREQLELGALFLPAKIKLKTPLPLFVHFHGGAWLPEVAAARLGNTAVITIQLGSGSSVYAKPFSEQELFSRLLDDAEKKAGARFAPLTLTAWSAGYGAVRELLRTPEHYARIDRVLLLDGLHTSYVGGKPGPQESQLETDKLEIFLRFARDAVAGKKRMFITHSEIFPGTFASTTETADWLVQQLGLARRAVLQWGPMSMQQLSEVRAGGFWLFGYAGNSAPDHVDHLHALPELLRLWRKD